MCKNHTSNANYIKKNINYIEQSHIRPADVLLSYGKCFYSKLVKFFDGGSYSHASIFASESVVECTRQKNGIAKTQIDQFIKEQQYVDLYRFDSQDHDFCPKSVVQEASNYLNMQESYDSDPELILLGIVLATRKLPENNRFDHDILLPVIEKIVDLIENYFKNHNSKKI